MGTALLTGPGPGTSGVGSEPPAQRRRPRSARLDRAVRGAQAAIQRRPWLDPIVLSAGIALVAVLVKLGWPRFTWFGDNSESFFPLWHIVGTGLRHGQWLGFDPTGFSGGNTVGEAAYGMFNPVTLANAVVVSLFDELARASFLVMVEFLVLLGLAVRSLARAYGARRAAAFTAGVIVPFGGFTLYWGAGNWASGLMALTWVTWTWWAARRYRIGAAGPAPLVVLGTLAVTVGSPYSLLGVLVILAATVVELMVARQPRRLAGLVVAGLCVGAVALLVYLPLMHVLPVTAREAPVWVGNKGYLAPSLGDLAGLSSPTLLPEINAWGGTADKVPSVYLSWLVLPLLPWLRWRSWGTWRDRLTLVVPTAVFLLLTLGPDRIWLFRWPLRLIEYSWVGLSVCLALVVSAGLARDQVRRRAAATAVLVAWSLFLAWSSTPEQIAAQLAMTAVVAVLVTATLAAVRRRGLPVLPAMALAGTLIVTPMQAALHGWDHTKVAPDLDLGRVSDLATVRRSTDLYRGTVMQISSPFSLSDPGPVMTGRLTFGHMLAAAGHPSVNRYTGIGYRAFLGGLRMDYRGSIAYGDVFGLLHRDVVGFDAPLVDVLGVDTVVLGRAIGYETGTLDRPGWHVVLQDPDRTVLQRTRLLPDRPRATASPGVRVVSTREAGTGMRLSVSAEHAGLVLLDRLDWPGYSATTADGRPVEVREGPLGLVELVVPPGTTTIDVRYEIPGLRTGLVAALAAALVAAAHQILWRRSRRRSTTRTTGTGHSIRRAAPADRGGAFLPARVTLPSQTTRSLTSRADPGT